MVLLLLVFVPAPMFILTHRPMSSGITAGAMAVRVGPSPDLLFGRDYDKKNTAPFAFAGLMLIVF
jgi:hypothetical protein